MRRGPLPLLGLALLSLTLAPPAGAVIGGRAVAADVVPQVVELPTGCTAALVAPDRLLTAGHCAPRLRPGDTQVQIAGAAYTITRKVVDERFDADDPGDAPHDAAVAVLDRPVVGLAPLALLEAPAAPGTRARLIGYGTRVARASARFGVRREAAVIVRSDAACRRALRRAGGRATAREYEPASMLCTQDPDHAAPYASGCFGDSGAPLLVGPPEAPVIAGVDAWGVACGTQGGDPEVHMEAADVRAFALAPDLGG